MRVSDFLSVKKPENTAGQLVAKLAFKRNKIIIKASGAQKQGFDFRPVERIAQTKNILCQMLTVRIGSDNPSHRRIILPAIEYKIKTVLQCSSLAIIFGVMQQKYLVIVLQLRKNILIFGGASVIHDHNALKSGRY